jgi:hypothetical protein
MHRFNGLVLPALALVALLAHWKTGGPSPYGFSTGN